MSQSPWLGEGFIRGAVGKGMALFPAAIRPLSCYYRPIGWAPYSTPSMQNNDTESYAKDLLLSGAHGKRKYLHKSEERDFWPISIS